MFCAKCGFNVAIYIFFPLVLWVQAGDVFVIDNKVDSKSLGSTIEVLRDPGGKLSILDVAEPGYGGFVASEMEQPGFGFTNDVFWVRLSVVNPQPVPIDWYFEVAYPLIDSLDFYLPLQEGGYLHKQTGDHLPFSSRDIDHRNFVFNLSEMPSDTSVYYVRFRTSSSMNFPLLFWSKEAFFEENSLETIVLGLFYGAVIIMIIYNIFLYIGFGDRSYIYIVLFLLSWGLAQLSLNGLAFQFIWPNSIWWANVNIPFFIFGSLLTATLFTRSLLGIPTQISGWDKVLKLLIVLFAAGMVFSLLISYSIIIQVASALGIATVIVLMLCAMQSAKLGVRSAWFFLAAWGLYFLGTILFALKSFGVVPSVFITNWGIQLGASALLVLFSIAVQDRINSERRERYFAQQAALKNEQKLVQTLKESEHILEEKVKARTAELVEKNAALNEKTEELQQSAKELNTLDSIVKAVNREVEFKNVINALLEHGLKLFPQARQGAALIYDMQSDLYRFVAAVGYDLQIFQDRKMTVDDIKASFSRISEEVIKGIYIVRSSEKDDAANVFNLTQSKTVLAMSISLEGQLAGFLLFDNDEIPDAFDHSDAHMLSRFRSHAISAFAKARLLEEMKFVTAEIMKTQDQLIVQEKMASLGVLTAGVAHEIKNPLNFVNNFAEGSADLTEDLAELIKNNKDDIPSDLFNELDELINDLKQNAIDILDNGRRADRIVRSMMDHARDSRGEKEFVNLNELMDENINLAYHGYRALDSSFNTEIEKAYDENMEPALIMQQDVGRVMLNILNNACYAIAQKIKEAGDSYKPKLTIRTCYKDPDIEIRIHDNGPGIAKDIREKIFSPFFTTKPTGEGNTGLGLSISYDIIVQQHHGKIKVESNPGEYTEFIITIPKGDR